MGRAGYRKRADRYREKLAAQRRKDRAKAKAPRPLMLGSVLKVMAGLVVLAALFNLTRSWL